MSKIISLEATNYKRLKAVRIDPDGHVVNITGRNAQGKSSILDAISAALSGASAKNTPRPVRDGEDSAEIIVTTDDVTVTRTFKNGKTAVKVTNPDGSAYPKPQEKLNSMLGKLSLDPIAFTALSDREQLNALLDLVDLPFDPAKVAEQRAEVFALRTDANREVKDLQAQANAFDPAEYAGLPEAEVVVADLVEEYRAGVDNNESYSRAAEAVRRAEIRVADLEAELIRAKQAAAAATATYEAHPEPVNLDDVKARLDLAEVTNRAIREKAAYSALVARLTASKAKVEALTEEIATIDAYKAEGLAKAVFPVDGLGFDTDGVTFGGVPFKQASSAEQLRVSLGMAIALNPELRVIRIQDGSLLDAESLALISETAEANDYQVWIETVSNGDGIGWLIEDGELVDPVF